MKTQTWFIFILIGFAANPYAGFSILALYAFNYVTSIIFGLFGRYNQDNY